MSHQLDGSLATPEGGIFLYVVVDFGVFQIL